MAMNIVEESKAVYETANPNSLFRIINALKEGFSFTYFQELADKSPFNFNEWAKFLHLSERTLQRYKTEDKSFDSLYSEKIMEISYLNLLGIEVFGSKESFANWLNTPSLVLGNHLPKDLLDTSLGISLVREELSRMQHGIMA